MLRGTKNFSKGYNRPVDGRKIGRTKKRSSKKYRGMREKPREGRQIGDPPRAADPLATPLFMYVRINVCMYYIICIVLYTSVYMYYIYLVYCCLFITFSHYLSI